MALSPEQRSSISLTNIDTHDCGVIALQAVTNGSREFCQKLLAAHGYVQGVGTPRGAIEGALREIGYTCQKVRVVEETPATWWNTHERGVFLIYVPKHVMALVHGDLHNARGNFGSPVDGLTEVTGPSSSPKGRGAGRPRAPKTKRR